MEDLVLVVASTAMYIILVDGNTHYARILTQAVPPCHTPSAMLLQLHPTISVSLRKNRTILSFCSAQPMVLFSNSIQILSSVAHLRIPPFHNTLKPSKYLKVIIQNLHHMITIQ